MKNFLLFCFIILCNVSNAQTLNKEEAKLYKEIMKYRKDLGLPPIPLAQSLTIVAQTHVKDLQQNNPVKGGCNLHSWSDKGKWTQVCYTADNKQVKGMWNKPRELTSYTANGYEVAYGGVNVTVKAENVLNAWKKSDGHNDLIVNRGIWKKPWNAIGIGVYGGYAVVWFGK